MDKKTKKQVAILRTRQQTLQRQLAGARKQCDDPQEIIQLAKRLEATEAELRRLAPPEAST